MATAAPATETRYTFKGEEVQVLETSGSLSRITPGDFWVKTEKLKLVRPKRVVNRHDAPALATDPLIAWMLTQPVTIRGDCPPQFFQKLAAAYEACTGEALDKDSPSLGVRDGDKSWGYSLYVDFPEPPADVPTSQYNIIRKERRVTFACEIANVGLVLGLFALGLRFGSNQPLNKQ